LKLRGIPYVRQHPVSVTYKDFSIGEGRVDLLVGNKLIVELKAVEKDFADS
jgi:GxxExxY protein